MKHGIVFEQDHEYTNNSEQGCKSIGWYETYNCLAVILACPDKLMSRIIIKAPM
jgi:hypothetical protein